MMHQDFVILLHWTILLSRFQYFASHNVSQHMISTRGATLLCIELAPALEDEDDPCFPSSVTKLRRFYVKQCEQCAAVAQ